MLSIQFCLEVSGKVSRFDGLARSSRSGKAAPSVTSTGNPNPPLLSAADALLKSLGDFRSEAAENPSLEKC